MDKDEERAVRSAVLDDRNLAEAAKEIDLWTRARRLALVVRLLHAYLAGAAVFLLASGLLVSSTRPQPSWGWLVGATVVATALLSGHVARRAGDDPPVVERRAAETDRLVATAGAVSAYSWVVAAIGVACIVVASQ